MHLNYIKKSSGSKEEKEKIWYIMNIEVYYFSGTGNSLYVAREIVKKVNGSLIPISKIINKREIHTETDNIGIVFPSYLALLYGIPLMVEKFIKKIVDIDKKYIFAVCTCGGAEKLNALPTLKNLNKLIKRSGGTLSAEFGIHLPMNNLKYPSKFINQDQEIMFKNSKIEIDKITYYVENRKKFKYGVLNSLFNSIMAPFYLIGKKMYINFLRKISKEPKNTKLEFSELIPLTDKSIYVDEKCNACQICTKVCPAHNIIMQDNKPIFQHHCEMCMACVEWCPKKAIHHWNIDKEISYHHPKVILSDMMITE